MASYAAAVMALDAFRKAALLETPPGPASRFQITVPGPSVTHEVSLMQVRTWASKRLRAVLEGLFSAEGLTNDLTT